MPLAPADQVRYAAGVLSQTFALRAALGSAPSPVEADAMTITTTRKFFWRCRMLRWHRWVVRRTEDGSRYLTCAHCGRDRDDTEWGPLGVGLGGGA